MRARQERRDYDAPGPESGGLKSWAETALAQDIEQIAISDRKWPVSKAITPIIRRRLTHDKCLRRASPRHRRPHQKLRPGPGPGREYARREALGPPRARPTEVRQNVGAQPIAKIKSNGEQSEWPSPKRFPHSARPEKSR